MAALDNDLLSTMCVTIQSKADAYVNNVNSSMKTLLQTMNRCWVSNAAQELATEIENCVNTLTNDIANVFNTKNEQIKAAVQAIATEEQENMYYTGFTFSVPSFSMKLNPTLPNGKKGVADGVDLNTINAPVVALISQIDSSLDGIVEAVTKTDAFSTAEQNALATSISTIKSTFDRGMDVLKSSLATRVNGEIDAKTKLGSSITQQFTQ